MVCHTMRHAARETGPDALHHSRLNPAVNNEAELFTDGKVTEAIQQGVAAMRGLPLLIERGTGSSVTERAEAAERGRLRATAE